MNYRLRMNRIHVSLLDGRSGGWQNAIITSDQRVHQWILGFIHIVSHKKT